MADNADGTGRRTGRDVVAAGAPERGGATPFGAAQAGATQVGADDAEQRPAGLRDKIAGFGVTFTTMFTRVVTEEYPEVKVPTQPRFHGRHQLNRHPDGLEKCVGCELCAWACPADAIYVEGADNTDGERYSPGERYGRVYQINYLRCIFCGLCIEACPTRALTMTNEYEIAGPTRAGLIYEKQDLLGPLLPGMVDAPHPMVAGTTEKDYYRGLVTEATPEQRTYVEARSGAGASPGHRSRQVDGKPSVEGSVAR